MDTQDCSVDMCGTSVPRLRMIFDCRLKNASERPPFSRRSAKELPISSRISVPY